MRQLEGLIKSGFDWGREATPFLRWLPHWGVVMMRWCGQNRDVSIGRFRGLCGLKIVESINRFFAYFPLLRPFRSNFCVMSPLFLEFTLGSVELINS